MRRTVLHLSVLAATFMLTACGEGWEAQKTDTYFPYGNQRTAGSGVVYVRAKMMPEKELKVEMKTEEPVPVVVEPEKKVEPVLKAEEIFDDANMKGSSKKKTSPMKAEDDKHSAMQHEIISEPEVQQALSEAPNGAVVAPDLTAEDYITQAPKKIDIPDVVVVDEPKAVEPVNTEANLSEIKIEDDTAANEDMYNSEPVEVTEEGMIRPISHIAAPKRDYIGMTAGQKSLDEIYHDPFY